MNITVDPDCRLRRYAAEVHDELLSTRTCDDFETVFAEGTGRGGPCG